MNRHIKSILLQFKCGHVSLDDAEREILALNIGSELGVLDAPLESHGDLLAVGKSHASGADSTEDSEQTSAGTLGKIIEAKEVCHHDFVPTRFLGTNWYWYCTKCLLSSDDKPIDS